MDSIALNSDCFSGAVKEQAVHVSIANEGSFFPQCFGWFLWQLCCICFCVYAGAGRLMWLRSEEWLATRNYHGHTTYTPARDKSMLLAIGVSYADTVHMLRIGTLKKTCVSSRLFNSAGISIHLITWRVTAYSRYLQPRQLNLFRQISGKQTFKFMNHPIQYVRWSNIGHMRNILSIFIE